MSSTQSPSPLRPTDTSKAYRGLGYRRWKLSRRTMPPAAIVIHTTGSGPILRYKRALGTKAPFKSPFDAAVHVYTRIMDSCGHMVLGQNGEFEKLVPDEFAAWHVGAKGSKGYHKKWQSPATAWWSERWPGLSSPTQLAGGRLWTGGSCNMNTIGIEVVPPLNDPRGPWSDKVWETLYQIIRLYSTVYGIPMTREYILSHSDAHPISRSAKNAPWDPGPKQWTFEQFEARFPTTTQAA